MAWDSKDTAMTISGLGSLASAWGSYETNKKRNDLLDKQLTQQQTMINDAKGKNTQTQSGFDDAFADSDFANMKKKKKTQDPLDTTDTLTA